MLCTSLHRGSPGNDVRYRIDVCSASATVRIVFLMERSKGSSNERLIFTGMWFARRSGYAVYLYEVFRQRSAHVDTRSAPAYLTHSKARVNVCGSSTLLMPSSRQEAYICHCIPSNILCFITVLDSCSTRQRPLCRMLC